MIKIKLKENKSILDEKLSSIVYHYRTMAETVNILEDDEFICGMIAQDFSSYADKDVEKKFVKDRFYYLSTARSPINHYVRRGTTSTDPAKDTNITLECAFELDGDKLKSKYKSVTIDFFNRAASKFSKYNPADEMEDRILTHEPTIKNAHKYIKMLHVRVTYVDNLIDRINEVCKSKNIPVAFYYYPDSFIASPKKQPFGVLAARYFRGKDSPEKRAMRLNKGIYFSTEEMEEINPGDYKFKSFSKEKRKTHMDSKNYRESARSLAFLALVSNVFDGTPIPADQIATAKEVKAFLETSFAGIDTDKSKKFKFDSEVKQFVNSISSGSALRNYPDFRRGITKLTDHVKEFYNKKKLSIGDYNNFILDMAKYIAKNDIEDLNVEQPKSEEPNEPLKENKIKIKIYDKLNESGPSGNSENNFGALFFKEDVVNFVLVDLDALGRILSRLSATSGVPVPSNLLTADELLKGGVIVGGVELEKASEANLGPCLDAYNVNASVVHGKFEGKGIAKYMYKLVSSQLDAPIIPDRSNVSAGAQRVWASLERDDTVQKDFKLDYYGSNDTPKKYKISKLDTGDETPPPGDDCMSTKTTNAPDFLNRAYKTNKYKAESKELIKKLHDYIRYRIHEPVKFYENVIFANFRLFGSRLGT